MPCIGAIACWPRFVLSSFRVFVILQRSTSPVRAPRVPTARDRLGQVGQRQPRKLAKMASLVALRNMTKRITPTRHGHTRQDPIRSTDSLRHEWTQTHVGTPVSRDHAGELPPARRRQAQARARRWPSATLPVGRVRQAQAARRANAGRELQRAAGDGLFLLDSDLVAAVAVPVADDRPAAGAA